MTNWPRNLSQTRGCASLPDGVTRRGRYAYRVRVLLVSTYELGHQPLHVASPAARLAAAGHDVSVTDVAVDPLVTEAISAVDAVAISVPMHTAMRLASDVIASIRGRVPAMPIALYGLYAGMGDVGDVDRVIVGEYENDLVNWVDALAAGDPTSGMSTSLERQRFLVPDRAALPPLDSYAHLAIGDDHRVVGYVEASHGCRHRCRHCPLPAVYDGRFRIVDPEVVVTDIGRMVDQGARHITFGDPDFFNGVAHAMKVLDLAHDTHPDLTFDATIKVEHLLDHRDYLRALVDRGVLFVTSAFETTNDEVLGLLDKGHTRADMVEALGLARDVGLEIHPSWLPFTPWTTVADVAEIFSFIDRFDLFEVTEPVQLSIRLLIPKGSLMLDIDGIDDRLEEYDDRALTYRWRSVDPAVDDLQRALAARAERAADSGEAPVTTLTDMWAMALKAAGNTDTEPQIPAGAITGRPRLTEPWFC